MSPFKYSSLLVLYVLSATVLSAVDESPAWKTKLPQQIQALGHRNWIVVVDSAYPLQIAPGIEAINTGADQLTVVKAVLAMLGKTAHVKPFIYTDAELPFVPEKSAIGITAYRSELEKVLAGRAPKALPHDQIIAKLDEAAKMFRVLVLKTNMSLPYTSVFMRLDCGYWDAQAEAELRKAMIPGIK